MHINKKEIIIQSTCKNEVEWETGEENWIKKSGVEKSREVKLRQNV